MKSFLLSAFAVVSLFAFTACQKCSNCTYTENGEDRAAEVCDNGRSYTDQIDQYEKAGWVCTDK